MKIKPKCCLTAKELIDLIEKLNKETEIKKIKPLIKKLTSALCFYHGYYEIVNGTLGE